MSPFANTIFSKSNFINFLFSLIPLSFIAGNLVINLNILILIIASFIFYNKKIFQLKSIFFDKLILFLFSLIIFTCIISNINTYFFFDNPVGDGFYNMTVIQKSILFLRFLFLYFVIRYLVENNIINFNFFFISCFFFSIFVSLDLFYQKIFGKDIFGYPALAHYKLSGPFGDEYIAGGYLQRFSIFSFFLIPYYFGITKKLKLFFIFTFLLLIYFVAIILSGNRMPMILFIFILCLIFLFEKKIRKFSLIFLLLISIIFTSVYNLNSKVKNNFDSFYNQTTGMVDIIAKKTPKKNKIPPHFQEFASFYDTWLMNKYFGGGLKSFRNNCHLRKNINRDSKFICNMHPHNYYLEILTDLGLIGFVTLIIIFSVTLYKSLYKKYFLSPGFRKNYLIMPFILVFLAEIFPIKSTGSFFTTGNATFIFLIMFVIIALSKEKN